MAENIFDRSSEKDGIEIAFLTQYFFWKGIKNGGAVAAALRVFLNRTG